MTILIRLSNGHKKQSKNIKWQPPKPKLHLNWVPPSAKQESKPSPIVIKPSLTTYYYPHYNGWDMPHDPLLFKLPSAALCWALSRFKKDGLSNIFGPDQYPHFMQFIGIAYTSENNVIPTTMPSNKKPSKIEKRYFYHVEFLQLVDSSSVTTKYMKCKDLLFQSCLQSMKSVPDYQSSSTSIYKPNTRCPTSSHEDVEFCHSKLLASKQTSSISFIKLEAKFKYMKQNSYCDHGKIK